MSSIAISALQFPGHVIKKDEANRVVVVAIQRRLNEVGCGPIEEDGEFGGETFSAVKLFQSRFTDADGLPLGVDGKVGSITWAALFGTGAVPANKTATSALLSATLGIAATQIGVMENPLGSNRGPQVDRYVASVGLSPAGRFAWCVAFLYFCFEQAANRLGRTNPMIKTAGVLDHWNRAGIDGIPRIKAFNAVNNPALVRAGQIFVIDAGEGRGHSGFVESVEGGKLITIEGNTNIDGSRDGIGVFRRVGRKIVSINRGFIDYNSL